jgi:HSP20 family molecular chaperone IbpA
MSTRKRRTISEIIDTYFNEFERWAEEFEETMMQRPSWNLKNCTIEPLREIMLAPTEVIITVDLPYTSKNSIKVKPIGHTSLEVSAKMNRKVCLDDLGVKHCKGEFESYQCHVRIPVPVKMDKMSTRFTKGILEIRIPRNY